MTLICFMNQSPVVFVVHQQKASGGHKTSVELPAFVQGLVEIIVTYLWDMTPAEYIKPSKTVTM